jgi:hypothetical protein
MPASVIVHEIELGTIRLLSSFRKDVRDLFEHLIASGDMRSISRGGHAYVAWDDVAGYSFEDGWKADPTPPGLSPTSDWIEKSQPEDPLKGSIEEQGRSQDAIIHARARLAATLTQALEPNPVNPFAQAITWGGFWSDAAFVAANIAGEIEAAQMRAAFTKMSESITNGTVNSIGAKAFHKTLLSLADRGLVPRFDEIWSKGGVELPVDPEKQQLALAALSQLRTMFDGYRGQPEGADTPRRAMDRYMSMACLVPGR